MQYRRTSDDGRHCRNAWSGLEVGAKEKARRKKCKMRFSLFKKKEQGLGSQEAVTQQERGGACSGDGSYRFF